MESDDVIAKTAENSGNFISGLDKKFIKNLGKEKKAGAPTILILSPAATGCLPFINSIKTANKKWKIGKLFAKHIKLAEQIKLLEKPLSIGVGTPSRVGQLVSFFFSYFILMRLTHH